MGRLSELVVMRPFFPSIALVLYVFLFPVPAQASDLTVWRAAEAPCRYLLRNDPRGINLAAYFRLGAQYKTQITGRGWAQTLYLGEVKVEGVNQDFLRGKIATTYARVNEMLARSLLVPEDAELVLTATGPAGYQWFAGRMAVGLRPNFWFPLGHASTWGASHDAILAHEYAHQVFEENMWAELAKFDSPLMMETLKNVEIFRRYQNVIHLGEYAGFREFPPAVLEYLLNVEVRVRSEIAGIDSEAFELFLERIVQPLNEVFADTVAVMLDRDPLAMSRSIGKLHGVQAMSRNFQPRVKAGKWKVTEYSVHDLYTPLRGYLWNSVILKNLQSDSGVLLKFIYAAMWDEIRAITAEFKTIDEASVHAYYDSPERVRQLNARMIQRVAARLPKSVKKK